MKITKKQFIEKAKELDLFESVNRSLTNENKGRYLEKHEVFDISQVMDELTGIWFTLHDGEYVYIEATSFFGKLGYTVVLDNDIYDSHIDNYDGLLKTINRLLEHKEAIQVKFKNL